MIATMIGASDAPTAAGTAEAVIAVMPETSIRAMRTKLRAPASSVCSRIATIVPQAAPETASVPAIQAPLLVQYAQDDERINAMWPAFEAALKAGNKSYEMFIYPGTQHGFHNNSTPRYNEAQAKIAWDRTIAFFKKYLA